MTKAEFKALQSDAYSLALDIGLRPAARSLGISEDRIRKWSSRLNWGFSKLQIAHLGMRRTSPAVTSSGDVKRALLAQLSDRTKVGFAISATKASEHLADLDAPNLIKPGTSISADTWSKVADRTHGWSAERTQAPTVQIANLVMPTDEDRAQRREIHKRLDDIAQKLARNASG